MYGCFIMRRSATCAAVAGATGWVTACRRFITRLLLVHGRWSHKRNAEIVQYAFYKNLVCNSLSEYTDCTKIFVSLPVRQPIKHWPFTLQSNKVTSAVALQRRCTRCRMSTSDSLLVRPSVNSGHIHCASIHISCVLKSCLTYAWTSSSGFSAQPIFSTALMATFNIFW